MNTPRTPAFSCHVPPADAGKRDGAQFFHASGDADFLERPEARFHLIGRPTTAVTILQDAADAIAQRAAVRDVAAERSMARCVAAYNALTGHALTETDGWLFMAMLKAARSRGGAYHGDDYTDGAAYFSLAGEAAFNAAEFAEA